MCRIGLGLKIKAKMAKRHPELSLGQPRSKSSKCISLFTFPMALSFPLYG